MYKLPNYIYILYLTHSYPKPLEAEVHIRKGGDIGL